jgi:cytochrome c biogenesis protein CcmG, thiol:disulfide interchange protein DsbE
MKRRAAANLLSALLRMKAPLLMLAGLGVGLALGLLIFFGGPVAGLRGENRAQRLPPTVGSPVEDFRLEQLDGSTLRLSDLRGKAVLVNFWATWCPPCREEMPLLEQTALGYADRLVVIGIDYGEDRQTVSSFVQEVGISFPIVLDLDGDVASRYFVRSYPASFFIDADGILRAQHLGALTENLLLTYLETVGIKQ